MKKFISLTLSLLIISLLFSACAPKNPISADSFITQMESEGFTVIDVTSSTETNGNATKVLIAKKGNYQIEFYQLINKEIGEAVFETNKRIFDEEHSFKTLSLSVSISNHNYYAFNADEDFHMISQIDDTMLYCDASVAYRDEIISIVEKLGYK